MSMHIKFEGDQELNDRDSVSSIGGGDVLALLSKHDPEDTEAHLISASDDENDESVNSKTLDEDGGRAASTRHMGAG